MLEQFLPAIKDPGDYLTALSLFKADAPLTAEEAEKLLAVYAKYLPETGDPEYCRVCLAADLLPGRTDGADFAALELGDAALSALFSARDIITGRVETDAARIGSVLEMVNDSAVPLPIRVLLARGTLDAAAASREIAAMRREISALADFLTGCGAGVLDRYTALVGEVRMKCRN